MYLKEICAMMHTFGDVKEPKEKSVQLMQTIVHDQMNLLLLEAEKIAIMRKSPTISHKDVLFLMRKNRLKLKRLLDYLYVLDLKETYNKDLNSDEVSLELKNPGKRVEKCLEFLASIEDCNEFTSVMKDRTIIDITTTKRKWRRHWMTNKMSRKDYYEFSKTSQASFCPLPKFRKWLLKDKIIDADLSEWAVRMIDFLARETIAEIVDMVLIMKMKKLGKYVPLYYDSFVHSNRSVLNLETSDALEQVNGNDDIEGDYSTGTAQNNVSSYDQHSRNQMYVNKGDNMKKKSHEGSKGKDIASVKGNDNLNELNCRKSDLLAYNLSRKPPIDERILQRERTECELMDEGLNCGSQSRVKLNECNETVHEPDAHSTKVDLNEASSETESNSVPVDSEKSENVFSSHMPNQMYDLIDISDDDITKNDLMDIADDDDIPKSAPTNGSSDMNQWIEPSDLSDTDLVSSSLFNSEDTFQRTPVASTSYQSQEISQIQDISDTSDCENFPREAVVSYDHKKSLKRVTSPNKHSKKIAQEESVVDNSTIANHLKVAALNEVTYITEPIEPAEIVEAFSRFQEPSPMVLIFALDHIPRKTKLICLAESSFNMI